MDTAPAGGDSTTLLIALIGAFAVIVGPALVAFINRGGKTDDGERKNLTVAQQDRLLEEMAELDQRNHDFQRDNARLREDATAHLIEIALLKQNVQRLQQEVDRHEQEGRP